MKIVISGVGEMGSHLARMLSGNGHEITVIESDAKRLSNVSNLADLITIEGDTTTFAVLRRAGVRRCDLFIAVNHDENQNILAAIMAKQLGAKKSIARIDNNEYLEPNNKEMFIDMGIDYLFYPEQVAATEVVNLLGHTSTTDYVDFSSGLLSLVVFRLEPTSPLLGRKLMDLAADGYISDFRAVAVTRGRQTIIPCGTDEFFEGDVVYAIALKEAAKQVAELSGQASVEVKSLMILGGSRIGVRVASELQDIMDVKIVEYNGEKAFRLAEQLEKTLIIHADGRNLEAMQAKRMGVKKVIAEVENLNYVSLAESVGIDTIINKKRVTASNIFSFTMSTDVLAIKCLTGSDAEVLEFIVKPNSPATKTTIGQMGLPEDVIIGGIVRGDRVFIATSSMQINAYDRVVVFAMPSAIADTGYYFN